MLVLNGERCRRPLFAVYWWSRKHSGNSNYEDKNTFLAYFAQNIAIKRKKNI